MNIELPFEVKSVWLKRFLLVLILGWMSGYSIYTSYYKAYGVDTYERYLEHRAGHSMFFNPWQYRLLCPLAIELIYDGLDHTLFPVMNIKGIHAELQGGMAGKNQTTVKLMTDLGDPVYVKHTLVFLGFRFLEDLTILLLAYSYLSIFVTSVGIRWLGLVLITLAMGNSVVDSDLTFNTYMDNIMYLWAGLVILKNYNSWWIVVITVIGAFNRETSVFIPALFFLYRADWSAWPNVFKVFLSDKKVFLVTAISTVLFLSIFFGIRHYYGPVPPLETWRVAPGLPMLKLNLLSASAVKTYMEFFGVFAFFPIWALFILRKTDRRLRLFFFILVPVWFALHLYTAIGFQTRLFLVPTLLVILPMILEYIDRKRQDVVSNGVESQIAV